MGIRAVMWKRVKPSGLFLKSWWLIFLLALPGLAQAEDYIRTGVYTGDGSPSFTVTGLGFQPELVIVKAATARRAIARTADMPEGMSKKLDDNRSLEPDRIESFSADGFTVGTHDDVNQAGVDYYWIAMKSVAGSVHIGQYTGNGMSIREVAVPGIFPDAALILPAGADLPVFRHTDMDFWEAYRLDGTGQEANTIGWFNNDAIYVGTDHSVNEDGRDYFYVAWQALPESVEFGTYVGNGLDGRDISGLSLDPEYMMIINDTATEDPVHRPSSLSGDATLFYNQREIRSNHIQAMWDGGFQVGDDRSTNESGTEYHWLAFANPPVANQADLQVILNFDDTSPNEGQTLNYTIEVTNLGPDTATGVEINYLVPLGLTLNVANPEQGSYDDVTGVWTLGDLNQGVTLNLSIAAVVDAGTGGSTITNTAQVTAADQTDPESGNNIATQNLTVLAATGADLEVAVTVDNTSPVVGEIFAYTVTVTNLGPNPATNVEMTVLVPASLNFESGTPSEGTFSGGGGWWDGIDLLVGETATVVVDCSPKNNTEGDTITLAPEVFGLDQVDPNSANDSDSVDIFVSPVDLQVTKLVNQPSPEENATITYTVLLSNVGAGDASGILVQDYWPSGVTFVSADATSGSYDNLTHEWVVWDLATTETVVLTLTGTVNPGTAGNTITNTCEITSLAQSDVNSANDMASVDVTVALPGDVDLVLTKAIDNGSPAVGDNVVYTVTVANPGANDATGIAINDLLPAGATFVSAMTNKGTYDEVSGLWTVGDLAAGWQAGLSITAQVEAAAVGVSVTNTATISAMDQVDPDLTNNEDSAELTVPTSDLQVSKTVSNPVPGIGDPVTYTVKVFNDGPSLATGIQVTDLLPTGVSFASAAPDQGTYDEVTGIWDVGSLNPSLEATLTIDVTVEPEAAGSTVSNNAFVTAVDQADPDAGNNSALVDFTVPGAELELTLAADTMVAGPGDEVVFTLTVTNNGPDAATGVMATQLVPAGLTFQSAIPSQGSFVVIPGEWTIGDLTSGASATLTTTVTVDPGTQGTVLSASAGITTSDLADPDPANNSDTASITVPAEIPSENSLVWPLVGVATAVYPGDARPNDVLTLAFANNGTQPDTLRSLALTNLTEGGGTPGQMDDEWLSLTVTSRLGLLFEEAAEAAPVAGAFTDGTASFDALDWAVPVGDTLLVTVRARASLSARDGAALRAGIAGAEDLIFAGEYTLIGSWPLVSGQSLEVDGFVAAQAAVVPRESGLLSIGSEKNLALTVDLPGNGFLDDTLYSISLNNSGSALPGSDITRIQVWADGGDLVFDGGDADDLLLGPASYSGDRWQLTGLNTGIPASGRRFYATVDIAETAQPSRDIRLSLPVGNGFAVEMYSGNDGPVDMALENPNTLGISVTDRIILNSEWFPTGVALPGADDIALLQAVLTNTYSDSRTLQSVTFTSTATADGADLSQLDLLCQQVDLRLDANHNGILDDLSTDILLGSGTFSAGRVTFGGLDLDLTGGEGTRLFVTADLGLMTVADGNRLSGQITSISDIDIPSATIVAPWPLASGVEWTVNGMIAQQLTTGDISVLTLGPGEGPVLALDLTIPANGYAADELTGITLRNEGSATASSIASAELWADGGDGLFNDGSGDDTSLGLMTLGDDTWSSTVLAQAIPTGGLQIFASLVVAESPQDSVTVRLGVPFGGITVSSGNDGPLDEAVAGTGTLVISTSPLRTSVDFATAATDTGQTGTVVMTVLNAGSETVTNIVPALAEELGAGLIQLGDPSPATVTSLDPGLEATISWPFTSRLPGEVVLAGNVSGFVNGDQVRRSIVTPTSTHRIYTPVPHLEMYPTANLPFSINRGQQGLVPLSLTFVNPGGDHVANAHLTSLRLSFHEGPGEAGIAPAELLDQIIVSEGTNTYLATTDLPTSGQEVELVFSNPVVITGSEPVTLGLRLDLRLNSTLPSFMVSIEDASWLAGNDAINGADLDIQLGEGVFPVATGQATLVSPAAGLSINVPAQDDSHTVPGQTDVAIMEIELSQSLAGDSSSTIDVGQLVFKFHDTDGQPLSNPEEWFARLSLRSSFQEHFSAPPVVEQDSLIVMALMAPVTITGDATLPLRLFADMAEDSPLGAVTPLVGSVDLFDARDGNMNNPVPVLLASEPQGAALTVLGPASHLVAAGEGLIPGQVSRGTRDLTAMVITLTHPGAVGTTSVVGDTIRFRFVDAARQPLDVAPYLDRIQLRTGAQIRGMVVDPTGSQVALSLAAMTIDPTQSIPLEVALDFKANCPTGGLEMIVPEGGILALDIITGEPVVVDAGDGSDFPVSSGLANVVAPAEELTVSAASLMPPLLAPQETGYPVMSLTLTNPAEPGSGGVQINGLTLGQGAAKANNPDLGQLVQTVRLLEGEDVIAETADLSADATSVVLAPAEALILAAGQTREFAVEVVLAADAPSGVLILLLDEDGVGAGPPGGGGIPIRILPVSGFTFPFATETGNIGGASLADSYANFPNPFAAGREGTTFAFSLLQDARVSLRVLTPHGKLVAELLRNEARPAGFYQDDVWSGLNGNGSPVHNGVYLAEIVAEFSDGSRQRILRKVAVVR